MWPLAGPVCLSCMLTTIDTASQACPLYLAAGLPSVPSEENLTNLRDGRYISTDDLPAMPRSQSSSEDFCLLSSLAACSKLIWVAGLMRQSPQSCSMPCRLREPAAAAIQGIAVPCGARLSARQPWRLLHAPSGLLPHYMPMVLCRQAAHAGQWDWGIKPGSCAGAGTLRGVQTAG